MSTILDRVPIPMQDDVAFVGGETVRVKACEIIVWVSLSTKHVAELGEAPRFPAIVDTGHTHNFSIREEHLIRWAGLRPESLRLLGNIRQEGSRFPLFGGDVWLYRNQRGKRDQLLNTPPHRLILPRGVAVYPTGSSYPRLPLLGMRAILSNRLRLVVDGKGAWASLSTPRPWWWPFG